MKLQTTIIALSLLATGCASTGKLPTPSGVPVRINNTDETQALLSQGGVVLIGPKKNDAGIRAHFMRHPYALLTNEPDRADMERVGAALVKTTVTVTFPDSVTEFLPTGAQRFHIQQMLKLKPNRVEIRGRTSNAVSTPVSVWYATERADAAKRFLLDRAVPGTDISINVLGAGDHVADNRTRSGRAKNQRVEIQFYFEGGTA